MTGRGWLGLIIAALLLGAGVLAWIRFEGTAPTGLTYNVYSVMLTRSPEEGVRVTAAPIPSRESEQRAEP